MARTKTLTKEKWHERRSDGSPAVSWEFCRNVHCMLMYHKFICGGFMSIYIYLLFVAATYNRVIGNLTFLVRKCDTPVNINASNFLREFCQWQSRSDHSGWWRSTVVERRSLAGELSLSCARPAADG